MIKISYPDVKPSIKTIADKEFIFCISRRKWVFLTPEEWVRQNFLLYLIQTLHYPVSLTAVEKQLVLGDVKKRFDIVVYGRNAIPFMIVECKEMNVPLSGNTLQQVLRYNINMQALYIVVTNGSYCMAFKNINGSFAEQEDMPGHIK